MRHYLLFKNTCRWVTLNKESSNDGLINYRFCKNFLNEKFKNCLLNELWKEDFVNNDKGLEKFCNINVKVLNKRTSWKKKFARGNQMSFMMKVLSKEITKWVIDF